MTDKKQTKEFILKWILESMIAYVEEVEGYNFDMLADDIKDEFRDNIIILANDCDLNKDEWEIVHDVFSEKTEKEVVLWRNKHVENLYALGLSSGYFEEDLATIFLIKEND